MMNNRFVVLITLLTSGICSGREEQNNHVRHRRDGVLDDNRFELFSRFQNRRSTTYICNKVDEYVYETVEIKGIAGNLLKNTLYDNFQEGLCGDLCQTLCVNRNFDVSDDKMECACKDVIAQEVVDTTISQDAGRTVGVETCGSNAAMNPQTKKCECLLGYEGNGKTGCTDIDECTGLPSETSSASVYGVGQQANPCGAYSICSNVPGSFECSCVEGFSKSSDGECVLSSCNNAMRVNPCGPGGMECIDLPGGDGYECKAPDASYYGDMQCPPIGCGPNALCIDNECECRTGFYRPTPTYPCIREEN